MDRFDHALRAGQFPVRWVEAAKPGFGQPLFNFYQVGFYYAVEAVHTMVPSLSRAFKLTVVGLWWAGSAFAFLWFARFGLLPAALAALMFALSPYLIHDAFVRAAYPEVAAIAFSVGVMWSVDRLLVTGRLVFVPLAAMLIGATLVCHLPAAMITAPVIGAYTLLLWVSRETTPRRVAWVAAAGVSGLGLAAFYVIPALGELTLVQITTQTRGHLDFHRHFVSPAKWFGLHWTNPARFGLAQWMVIATAAATLCVRLVLRRFDRQTAWLATWLCVVASVMFMTTAPSIPLWEAFRPLSFVQFPWRFVMLIPIATAAMAALLLSRVNNRIARALCVIGAVVLHVALYRGDLGQAVPQQTPSDEVQFLDLDDPEWRNTINARRIEFIEYGYYPDGVTVWPTTDIGRWSPAEGQGQVTEVSVLDHRLILDVVSDRGLTLTVHTPFFPGWTVRSDDRASPFRLRPRDQYIVVPVPPGHHRVDAVFENTPIRLASNAVSMTSLIVLAASFGYLALTRRRLH